MYCITFCSIKTETKTLRCSYVVCLLYLFGPNLNDIQSRCDLRALCCSVLEGPHPDLQAVLCLCLIQTKCSHAVIRHTDSARDSLQYFNLENLPSYKPTPLQDQPGTATSNKQ